MSTTTVSKVVTMINDPTLTSLSERIAATQTLLELHEKIRKNHQTAFTRHAKNASASLDEGVSPDTLTQMDKGIEIQKKICDETDEMAKYARDLVEFLEERQKVIRGMFDEDEQMAS
ncbi:hypothetical protein KCU77_g8037, partial [Aureobasidium melanogenum]